MRDKSIIHPIEHFYPGRVKDVLEVCNILQSKNISPKEFMRCFFLSDNTYLKTKRRLWGNKDIWPSSMLIVLAIRKTVCEQEGGDVLWNELVLQEAQRIVTSQDPPRESAPAGSYFSSGLVTPDFFSEENLSFREIALQKAMPFLYKLVNAKIMSSIEAEDDIPTEPNASKEFACHDGDGGVDVHIEDDEGDILENVQYAKPHNHRERKQLQAKAVPTAICGMVAFVCNRRSNGMQLLNAMTFYACGASDRLNEFLHFLGLASSRKTALEVADTLRKKAEQNLIRTLSKSYLIEPFLCVDNINFQEHIHSARVESKSTMFHGSTGYYHVIPDSLTEKLNKDDCSYAAFESAMQAAEKEEVNVYDFLPNEQELAHLAAVSKAQIYQAYLDYIAVDADSGASKKRPKLATIPPEINQIAVKEAEIHMLKLMNAPDTSAEGVSQLMAQVAQQVERDPAKHLDSLHIIEGDVGTCMNFESMREKRIPALNLEEGFLNCLSAPGLTHVLWNVMQAVVGHHLGDSSVALDTGLWRTAYELTGKIINPTSKKDFSGTLHIVHQVHAAEVTSCLAHIIETRGATFDYHDTQNAQSVVDACYDQYFTIVSLDHARENGDQVGANLRLRLRDLGTVVEMDAAMKAGDIGRVMVILKLWSVMSHGVRGMSHYARHIPRLVLLLEKYLPRPLAHVVKHSLLIPASGRAGHFIAKDFYLELQNFWLKYFYNNAGQGTNIQRLTDRISLNIDLFCKLLRGIKVRSGQNIVFQSHHHRITSISLNNFIRKSKHYLFKKNYRPQPDMVKDTVVEGFAKMQEILRKEAVQKTGTRYCWGCPNSFLPEQEEEETRMDEESNVNQSSLL